MDVWGAAFAPAARKQSLRFCVPLSGAQNLPQNMTPCKGLCSSRKDAFLFSWRACASEFLTLSILHSLLSLPIAGPGRLGWFSHGGCSVEQLQASGLHLPQPHLPGLPSGLRAKAPTCARGDRAALARISLRGGVASGELRWPAAGSGLAD